MKTKTYPFKESEKLSIFVLEHLRTISTPQLQKIIKQYARASQTNCPWYVYRTTGIAGLAKAVIVDRGWREGQSLVARGTKKAKP